MIVAALVLFFLGLAIGFLLGSMFVVKARVQ